MLSQELFGRQIKHIFLIHANELNADYLDDVVKAIKSFGYQFTTLEDALTDEAYKLPDNFLGKYGPVWTQRWALDKELKDILIKEPDIPLNIRELNEKY
jgi:hypothetical protein